MGRFERITESLLCENPDALYEDPDAVAFVIFDRDDDLEGVAKDLSAEAAKQGTTFVTRGWLNGLHSPIMFLVHGLDASKRLLALDRDGGIRMSVIPKKSKRYDATHHTLLPIVLSAAVDPDPMVVEVQDSRKYGRPGRFTRESFTAWTEIGYDNVKRWLDVIEHRDVLRFEDSVRCYEARNIHELDVHEEDWYWVTRQESGHFSC